MPTTFTALDRAGLALAVFLLGAALQIDNGFFTWTAFDLLAAAVLIALAASCGAGRVLGRPPARIAFLLPAILCLGLAWSFWELATTVPVLWLEVPFSPIPPGFLGPLMGGALCAALIALDPTRSRTLWFPGVLLSYAALGGWILRASPHPDIDVVSVYNAAISALQQGRSPYHVTFFNLYGQASSQLYPSGTLVDPWRQVHFGFPYPPLALLMVYPAAALHDYRVADLAALILGAAGIGYASRTRCGLLAACALLYTPRSLLVLESGWSEPLTICWIGVLTFVAVRRRAVGTPLGLLLASKQHLVLSLFYVGWLTDRGRRTRAAAVACALAAVVTVPFVAWDLRGFWKYVVALQLHEQFRAESLSVLTAIFAWRGVPPSGVWLLVPTVAALLLGLLIAWRGTPRTPGGFAAAMGLIFVLMFAFSKKAFCNYYFLVIAFWCTAIAARDPDPPVTPAAATTGTP